MMRWTPLIAALFAIGAGAFDLQGHRGARGLAPENTLAAFQRALDLGVTTIETDVVVTRDNVPVIAHDRFVSPDLARGPDGAFVTTKGVRIRSLTLAELKRYDIGTLNPAGSYASQWPEQQPAAGQRYPTLVELLQLIKASGKPVKLSLETKLSPYQPDDTPPPTEFVRLVVDVLRKENFVERTTLQSFDWRTLAAARQYAPGIATSCLTMIGGNFDNVTGSAGRPSRWTDGLDLAAYGNSVPRLARAAGCQTWSVQFGNLTREQREEARALGLTVIVWTVNEPRDIASMLDLQVDGIITDYPDRVRQALAARAMPLP